MRLGVIDFSENMQTLGHFFEPLYAAIRLLISWSEYLHLKVFLMGEGKGVRKVSRWMCWGGREGTLILRVQRWERSRWACCRNQEASRRVWAMAMAMAMVNNVGQVCQTHHLVRWVSSAKTQQACRPTQVARPSSNEIKPLSIDHRPPTNHLNPPHWKDVKLVGWN